MRYGILAVFCALALFSVPAAGAVELQLTGGEELFLDPAISFLFENGEGSDVKACNGGECSTGNHTLRCTTSGGPKCPDGAYCTCMCRKLKNGSVYAVNTCVKLQQRNGIE